ncbi:hypothetical protein WMY93_026177 [Mugilogobius chulae]|uniref:Uncharacterized protein n=1 Tax=Mugilogobius chulae TaxID=88201 RepID=A0AAW0N6Z8_9GOBI
MGFLLKDEHYYFSSKRTALQLSSMSLFLPQNGVAEGAVHIGAADSSAAATMDTRKGTTGPFIHDLQL